MKASDLQQQNFFKGLIYGDSGSGKTVFAASFAALGPVEYWDFDNKISSAVRHFKDNPILAQIDVHQFGALPLKERIRTWETRLKLLDAAQTKGELLPFKTLVLDSITTLSHHLMEDYMFVSQLGIKRALVGVNALQDYQLYDKHMTRMLVGILSLQVNVVVLAHVETEKDETTGAIVRRPLALGKQLTAKLPIWFEEVYAAHVKSDGKRVLQTKAGNGYIARTQRGLPAEIEMDVKELKL